jgi:hypothetical protein
MIFYASIQFSIAAKQQSLEWFSKKIYCHKSEKDRQD